MLRGIHKATSNWLGKTVMAVVMGLLVVSFAIWGIGDIFRGFGRNAVAKIGNTEISIEQFRQLYTDRLQQVGRQVGRAVTPDQASGLGLDRQLLSQIVAETTLDEYSRKLRLGLSDAEISRRITSDPSFRGANGQFDRARFEQLIRNAGFSEPRFVDQQRRDTLRRQIVQSIIGEMKVPTTALSAINQYQNEKRSIEYLTLTPAQAGDIPAATPEVLSKYFDERKVVFRAPEYRKITLLSLTPADIAKPDTVSDADAKAYFEQNKNSYGTPERRELRQIVFPNPQDAAIALKWAVYEMERRYEMLSENGARSILEFNRRLAEGQTLRRSTPASLDETDPERWIYRDGPLPYIVVVVEELADLMMAVQAEIEKPLAQLAQKARAIGIHLIVATQRPSVNVITGLIKANFPCRLAFRVSAKVDSRTILDQNGADALLGNGDMLFLPPGSSDPVRIQGAYLSTEETERLMAWYREQAVAIASPRELEEDVLETVRAREAEAGADEGMEEFDGERDKLFREAAEICIQFSQGSTSLLQRRLRIGYGRAARIIDQLHNAGVLGPPDGSRPREVLLGFESLNAICGDT